MVQPISQVKPFSDLFCQKTQCGSRSEHSRRQLNWPCLLESRHSQALM